MFLLHFVAFCVYPYINFSISAKRKNFFARYFIWGFFNFWCFHSGFYSMQIENLHKNRWMEKHLMRSLPLKPQGETFSTLWAMKVLKVNVLRPHHVYCFVLKTSESQTKYNWDSFLSYSICLCLSVCVILSVCLFSLLCGKAWYSLWSACRRTHTHLSLSRSHIRAHTPLQTTLKWKHGSCGCIMVLATIWVVSGSLFQLSRLA